MKKTLPTFVAAIVLLVPAVFAYAAVSGNGAPPLSIQILSPNTLNGTAGDYVTVQGQLTNAGSSTLSAITTYLSLVDTGTKLPVDLEDWSAEKGLYIGSIDAGQTFPLSWKIHFVKAGTYSLIIVAETPTSEVPQVSTVTHFNVSPKRNLNPGQVLPVALGTPIVLLCVLFVISYRRRLDEE